jgi:hypothetical protein
MVLICSCSVHPPSRTSVACVVDLLLRLDRETALVVEAAADGVRCKNAKTSDGSAGQGLRRALAEDVQQRGQHDECEQAEEEAPQREFVALRAVAVLLQGQELRQIGRERAFAVAAVVPCVRASSDECARHDSNVRPLPPQGSALSPELRARGA